MANELKYSKILTSCAIAIVGGLGIAGAVSEHLHEPLNAGQETIVTSTSQVVVVVIPGFPIESLAIGALLGFVLLVAVRRWRLKEQRSAFA
jgi:predicted histidine transporter YuiF (NhaC family)